MTVVDDRAGELERENAELRRRLAEREAEFAEALEQQTATAEVLQVINSSPGDLAPVFEAILGKAHTLCGATLGALATFDGAQFHFVAGHGEPDFVEYSVPASPDGNAPVDRLSRGEPLGALR